MTKMVEILRSLMKGKEHIKSLRPQSEAAQLDGRRDEPTYPPGFTLRYASTVHMAQTLPICHTPNPGCDRPETNIHLCLQSLNLLATYRKSGMTLPIRGGCPPVNNINRKQ